MKSLVLNPGFLLHSLEQQNEPFDKKGKALREQAAIVSLSFLKINSSKGKSVIVGFIDIPLEDLFVHQNLKVLLFKQLNLDIDGVKLLGPLLLVGDLNSRVRSLQYNCGPERTAQSLEDNYNNS